MNILTCILLLNFWDFAQFANTFIYTLLKAPNCTCTCNGLSLIYQCSSTFTSMYMYIIALMYFYIAYMISLFFYITMVCHYNVFLLLSMFFYIYFHVHIHKCSSTLLLFIHVHVHICIVHSFVLYMYIMSLYPYTSSLLSLSQLLAHDAVFRWDESIMKGIREMTLILMELISIRLKYKPVPVYLLNLLSLVSDERE